MTGDGVHELAPGYGIRRAVDGDMDAACEIAKRAWVRIHESFRTIMGKAMYEVVCADWEAGKAAQVRGHFEHTPEWFYVVVDAAGTVVGFVTFRADKKKSLGAIGNNAIDLGHQGRGVGAAMHAFALDRFREMGLQYASVTTGLDDGHAPARRAYEKAGFTVRQENVTYYMAL